MRFNQFKTSRIKFLEEHKENDHAVISGKGSVLLSAPHGVSQVRLGKNKVAEIGTISLVLALQKRCNSFAILKTKNNLDDANFDETSKFKTSLNNIIEKNNIKYLFDFHGLAAKREMDVNLGINFGHNIESNPKLFEKLVKLLKTAGFIVSIDQPFSGGHKTISGSTKETFSNIFAVQVEINSAITNFPENINKLNTLLNVFEQFINELK